MKIDVQLYAIELEKRVGLFELVAGLGPKESVTRYVLARDVIDAANTIQSLYSHATIKSVVQFDTDVWCSRAALAEFKEMAREVVP